MQVELRQMRYFVAVAEELNFTRAAERLHMAQQPLSAAIARLEQQLGFKLLERNTRRVALTEAGTAFLEAARSALAAADAAVDVAQAAARGLTGDVAIGMSAGAWYGLAELFERLRDEHPGLRLNVRQQSSQPLVRAVGAGELDLAVGLCVPQDPSLEMHRLKDEPVVLVAAADHALAALAESCRELRRPSGNKRRLQSFMLSCHPSTRRGVRALCVFFSRFPSGPGTQNTISRPAGSSRNTTASACLEKPTSNACASIWLEVMSIPKLSMLGSYHPSGPAVSQPGIKPSSAETLERAAFTAYTASFARCSSVPCAMRNTSGRFWSKVTVARPSSTGIAAGIFPSSMAS